MIKQIKDFYCENCFQEHLTTWKEQEDGTIVCSDKCWEEINRIKEENRKPIKKARKSK